MKLFLIKNNIIALIIYLLLTYISCQFIFANNTAAIDVSKDETLDSLSFKYHFEPGDSLYYSVFSRDSVIINYDDPLLRLRRENILITCDSINKSGNFCLTQVLLKVKSIESYRDEQNIKHEGSMWANKPVYIEIDSLGNRIKVFNQDTNHAITAPGGVFKPTFLIALGKNGVNKKGINESWLLSSTDELVENGYPIPVFKNTTLLRLMGMSDTMGYNMMKFTFARSGQASHEVVTKQYSVKTSGVINSGGEFYIDTTFWLPIVFMHTLEQKLTLYYPDDKDQPGRHFIYSTFICDKIVRNKETYYPNIKIEKQQDD